MNHRDTSALTTQEFDVLVIGAGITGAWVAFDCALRNLRVALIDKDDYGAATSAKSSKLIHGGIRYLQQFHFGKVRESAIERAYYHYVAPHLTHFIPFLIPTFKSIRQGKLFLGTGLGLYQLLCFGENRISNNPAKRMPKMKLLNRQQVLTSIGVNNPDLTGGIVFPESHMESSERMTVAVIFGAVNHGCTAYNYVVANDFIIQNNQVKGIYATDRISGKSINIRSRITINAGGPWIGSIGTNSLPAPTHPLTTGFARGSHIITRQLLQDYAIAMPTDSKSQSKLDRGGRHVFVIPWRGHSLIGTSYAPASSDLDKLTPKKSEAIELITVVNNFLPHANLKLQDIKSCYAGIYPLQESEIFQQTYQGSGSYQLIDHEVEVQLSGLLSVLGAKYTTARLLAEKTANLVLTKLGKYHHSHPTRKMSVKGGNITDLDAYIHQQQQNCRQLWDTATVNHLIKRYGTDIEELYNICSKHPELARPIYDGRPTIRVEAYYAVNYEQALHLDDLLFRRTDLATIGMPPLVCREYCANLMKNMLGWDKATYNKELTNLELQQKWLQNLCALG